MPKHTVRKRSAHTKASEAKGKYVVVIDRTEQDGEEEEKRVPFRQRDAALKLAELIVRKRKLGVRVLNPYGQEIFPC
jgi:hypothetical protein